MKFGIYSSIADPPRGERLDQRIDEVIAEARLAEDVITLDLVSKGRIILGVGLGYQEADFHSWSEAVGAEYFLLRLRHAHSGGPPHEKIMDAIRLFGEKVIPACG